ncbi:O-sialoglycoprotein endopeptidase [Sporomusa aerivorans]|uniref:Kae1-like domain-containing protein n=1 Tax=Sporomusa aerivorans TaxID=204936 RepID=UPI00352AFEA2
MNYVLGIDTSCYTTSVAILDEQGQLISDCRRILQVKTGGRGLQQSEMVFQHTRSLPELFAEACLPLGKPAFKAIGVSAFPRPLPDSYMPAFLVGDGYAKILSVAQGIPLLRISHQENHILAGIWSAQGPKSNDFLAVHLSGGTTEIVRVSGSPDSRRLSIEILGESQDIHAGQLIDRIGVLLGLPFPAGPHLELLAANASVEAFRIPFSIRNACASFAGPETFARKLIEQGADTAAVAAGIQLCVANAVAKMILYAITHTGLTDVLLVGGVTANNFVRNYLTEQLVAPQKANLYYPDINYSPDNATGAAYYALICR